MVLVDTSVWISHFRYGKLELSNLLRDFEVTTHPFVIGELACGNLKNRKKILEHLNNLPSTALAQHEEVLGLIETHKLMGQGIGWVDSHLLAAAMLSEVSIWTEDTNLQSISAKLGLLYINLIGR